jgi:hypothetical protein
MYACMPKGSLSWIVSNPQLTVTVTIDTESKFTNTNAKGDITVLRIQHLIFGPKTAELEHQENSI